MKQLTRVNYVQAEIGRDGSWVDNVILLLRGNFVVCAEQWRLLSFRNFKGDLYPVKLG